MKKLFLYKRKFFIFYSAILIFLLFYTISYLYFYKSASHNESLTFSELWVNSTEEITPNKYIVGVKNGSVIVYLNNKDNVYDYTGINANTIRVNDEESYRKLLTNVVIYGEEELYSFLEAISN